LFLTGKTWILICCSDTDFKDLLFGSEKLNIERLLFCLSFSPFIYPEAMVPLIEWGESHNTTKDKKKDKKKKCVIVFFHSITGYS
jgi:hypothetical protein